LGSSEVFLMTDLWEEWITEYRKRGIEPSRMCRDGVLAPEEYTSAHPRLLFVMKEVNDLEGGSLQKLLRDGPVHQMWHAVSRWAAGLLNGFPPFEDIDTYAVIKRSLKKVASINLKKTSGKARSNMSVVGAYSFIDRHLLRRQIQEIGPQLVIACGTWDVLVWLLELEVDPDNLIARPAYSQLVEAWVLPFRHPARTNNRVSYDDLKKRVAMLPNNWLQATRYPHA